MTQDNYIDSWMTHLNDFNRLRMNLPYESQIKLSKLQEEIEGLIKEASQDAI